MRIFFPLDGRNRVDNLLFSSLYFPGLFTSPTIDTHYICNQKKLMSFILEEMDIV